MDAPRGNSSWLVTIVIAVSMLRGCVLFVAYAHTHCGCVSKAELAARGTQRIAFDAFPAWLADHPDGCPSPSELEPYLGDPLVDPWGTPYHVQCVRDDRATRLLVHSYGEDRHPDTPDDIWSDDR
jgi:hypothetical protein